MAHALLADWGRWSEQFSVIMPRDYRRALEARRAAEAAGTTSTGSHGGRTWLSRTANRRVDLAHVAIAGGGLHG